MTTANERKTNMSERDSETYLLAATIDPVEVGQPLLDVPHMTILQWFHATNHPDFFDARLEAILTAPNALGKWVGKSHLRFGKRFDIPVREMAPVGKDKEAFIGSGINFATRALMRSMGGQFVEEQFNTNFAPHITDQPSRKIDDREVVTFSTATLFKRTAEGDIAHAVYSLTNTEESA